MTQAELAHRLRCGGIENSFLEARLIFAHVTQLSPAHLLANPEASAEDCLFEEIVRRRCNREPLQYLLGEVGFYRETYRVAPGVLIPRSDTELLVEHAIRLLPQGSHFADLCTGTGCIAISVLSNRPDLTADAYDVSPHAISLAAENAKRNGVSERLTVIRADLLRDLLPQGRYSAILSNPPYIPSAVIPTLSPEVQCEPSIALDGGADGMTFYRTFLERHTPALAAGGFFLFEIGYDEEEAITRLAKAHGLCPQIHRDLGSNPRLALLK